MPKRGVTSASGDEKFDLSDKEYLYGNPVTLYDKPVREDFLQLDPDGSALVCTLDGKFVRVVTGGKPTLIREPKLPPLRRKTRKRDPSPRLCRLR